MLQCLTEVREGQADHGQMGMSHRCIEGVSLGSIEERFADGQTLLEGGNVRLGPAHRGKPQELQVVEMRPLIDSLSGARRHRPDGQLRPPSAICVVAEPAAEQRAGQIHPTAKRILAELSCDCLGLCEQTVRFIESAQVDRECRGRLQCPPPIAS